LLNVFDHTELAPEMISHSSLVILVCLALL